MSRLSVALALVAALASGGTAAPTRRVAVVAVAEGPAQAERLLDAGRGLGTGDLEVVGDGPALARAARARGAVAAEQVRQLAAVSAAGAEGWRAYLQVALPYAASRLAKARGDAEPLLPLPGGLELYADLSLRLGAVLLALERREEAEEALALARTLDPARELSLVEFSPDIVEAIGRVTARPRATATLTVTTPGVAGVQLELDGQLVGVTAARGAAPPTLAISLAHGQHVILARRAGYEPAAQALRVEGAAAVTLQLAPDRLSKALTQPLPGLSEEAASALAEAVITFADVDETLWLAQTTRRGAPALLAQRCDARPRCTAVVEVGFLDPGLPSALRAAWAQLSRGELRYPPTLPSDSRLTMPRISGGESRCRWCRSPWLWGSLGVALVGSAVLIAALAADTPPPILIVDPGDF